MKWKTAIWLIKWWLLLVAGFWSAAFAGSYLGVLMANRLMGQ
ncbi:MULTISPECIES: hypothetical protein [unclassified Neisseria]|nr:MULTISPECIES: hypothetical protein [unclassified Neisseria]MDO1509973.1 hypothetical protein [Neisseria sp. MVDL19-042950]MDO1516173.1 hypothetical protein [Neisseria sp. MVDL18-041461]MDO1563288.1 hypothetical protein [Neisseria sp. MVDL20-010259]